MWFLIALSNRRAYHIHNTTATKMVASCMRVRDFASRRLGLPTEGVKSALDRSRTQCRRLTDPLPRLALYCLAPQNQTLIPDPDCEGNAELTEVNRQGFGATSPAHQIWTCFFLLFLHQLAPCDLYPLRKQHHKGLGQRHTVVPTSSKPYPQQRRGPQTLRGPSWLRPQTQRLPA